MVGVWGAAGVQNSHFTNMRIRDTYADGINLTNDSPGNLISNDEARTTGDDSFALFAANDQEGGNNKNNTIQNVTALMPWRAAGVAVYGGDNNTIQNFRVADTLCYSGLTISSLNFGFSFQGFTPAGDRRSPNYSLARDGGHFWGNQVFGAIWVFSATKPFQGIRVNNAHDHRPDVLRHHVPDRLLLGRSRRCSRSPTSSSRTPRSPVLSRAVTRTTPSPATASGPTRCRRPVRARRSARSPSTT